MRPRISAAGLAWTLLTVSLVGSGIGLAMAVARNGLTLDDFAFGASFTSVQVVGALLLARQPRNVIGRLMSGLGLLIALQVFVNGYALPVEGSETYLWGGVVLTWMMAHTYLFLFTGIGLLFFLFPTGELAHPRWRHAVRVMVVGLVVAAPALYLSPGPLDDEGPVGPGNPANPYTVDLGSALDIAATVGAILLLGGVALSVASLILRYRSSAGIMRLQMKWFATGAGCFAAALCANLILRNFFSQSDAVEVLTSLAVMFIPISIGNAILRYRLYEIDVFINRALVYGTLTAFVVAAYLGLVVTLQVVLEPVTNDSDLAVAASTLAVAALIRPLRARIQGFIDRRFYRRKYDAQQTLATLTRRLRDEVDLQILGRDVVNVVRETVQPVHASLWLRSVS